MKRHMEHDKNQSPISRAALEMLCIYHSEGQGEALERLGVDSSLIRRVRRLPVASYHRLLSRLGSFVDLRLDNDILDLQLRAEEARMNEEEQARQLILAGAPFPMIESLYGWRRELYQFERRLAGMLPFTTHGRPRLPDEAVADRISSAWYAISGSERRSPQNSDQWLELLKQSEASLTEIWYWYRHQLQENAEA